MTGLPPLLQISIWLTALIWVIGLLAYALGAPLKIVLATFAVGVIGGIAEWYIGKGIGR